MHSARPDSKCAAVAAGPVSEVPQAVVIPAAPPCLAANAPIRSHSSCGRAAAAKNTSRSREKKRSASERSRSSAGTSAA
jgi:hypothetical protein